MSSISGIPLQNDGANTNNVSSIVPSTSGIVLDTTAAGGSMVTASPSPLGVPVHTVAATPALPTSPLPVVSNSTVNNSILVNNSNAATKLNNTSVASSVASLPSPATQVLDRKRLQELVKEVDPNEQLDEDVEDLLLHIADDFIEQTVSASCALARHRKAATIEVKDVQFVLERNWNMWIPGFGTEEVKPYKKSAMTEAHRARMALIKKTLKKY